MAGFWRQFKKLTPKFDLSQAMAWGVVKTQSKTHLKFDQQLNRVIFAQHKMLGALVVKEENSSEKIAEELLVACWCQQIRKKGLQWLKFDDSSQQLLLRWRWLTSTQRHLLFPEVNDAVLLANLEQWLGPYLTGITTKAQLDKVDFSALLFPTSYRFNNSCSTCCRRIGATWA